MEIKRTIFPEMLAAQGQYGYGDGNNGGGNGGIGNIGGGGGGGAANNNNNNGNNNLIGHQQPQQGAAQPAAAQQPLPPLRLSTERSDSTNNNGVNYPVEENKKYQVSVSFDR